jgi:hypothetical protein
MLASLFHWASTMRSLNARGNAPRVRINQKLCKRRPRPVTLMMADDRAVRATYVMGERAMGG